MTWSWVLRWQSSMLATMIPQLPERGQQETKTKVVMTFNNNTIINKLLREQLKAGWQQVDSGTIGKTAP